MSTTVTLVYKATAQGPTKPVTLENLMAAVDLDPLEIETATGCSLTSDATTLSGSTAKRTIIFNINHAEFHARFPAGTDQAAAFYGLYTQRLSMALNTFITEVPPVVA